MHPSAQCSGKVHAASVAISGSFRDAGNPVEGLCVSTRGTRPSMIRRRFANPPQVSERYFMHITVAHITPIMSLIAGVLILIMPRFLNFIVAIYLIVIGLAGLGVFKMLKF
jgi:hypothetical protein